MSALGTLLLVVLAGSPLNAHAWSFSVQGNPTQCAPFQVNVDLEGAVQPTFTFLNLAGEPNDFSTWQAGASQGLSVDAGTTVINPTLPWSEGTQLVVVGSDATGFGSGGTSSVFTIGASTDDDTSCVAAANDNAGLALVESWTNPITQCGLMSAVFQSVPGPVAIDVVLPTGRSFVVPLTLVTPVATNTNGPAGTQINWTSNLTVGTNLAFYVSDANGPIFTSPLLTVQNGNSNCLPAGFAVTEVTTGGSPVTSNGVVTSVATAVMSNGVVTSVATAGGIASSLTMASGSPQTVATGTGITWATSTLVPNSAGSSSGISTTSSRNVGAIVGGVIGGLVGLALIGALIMFFMHRYNRERRRLERQTAGLTMYAPGHTWYNTVIGYAGYKGAVVSKGAVMEKETMAEKGALTEKGVLTEKGALADMK